MIEKKKKKRIGRSKSKKKGWMAAL